MVAAVRAGIRFVVIILWTLFMYAIRLAVRPFASLAPATDRKVRRWVFRTWSAVMCRILGVRLVVEGEPPEAPFFLVSNHINYLDIIMLSRVLSCVFVAKQEIRAWPLLGWIIDGMGTIFINRKDPRETKRVNEIITHAMDRGEAMVVFIEGGTGDGSELLPFRPPLLQPAAQLELPVHYALIHYATPRNDPPAHATFRWRNVSLLGHLWRVMRLPGFTARLRFGDEPIQSSDRKELAAKLHDACEKAFEPLA